MTNRALEALAARVEACAEDAKQPMALVTSGPFDPFRTVEELPDPRIVSLANGLEAVAAALRSIAAPQQERE